MASLVGGVFRDGAKATTALVRPPPLEQGNAAGDLGPIATFPTREIGASREETTERVPGQALTLAIPVALYSCGGCEYAENYVPGAFKQPSPVV